MEAIARICVLNMQCTPKGIKILDVGENSGVSGGGKGGMCPGCHFLGRAKNAKEKKEEKKRKR